MKFAAAWVSRDVLDVLLVRPELVAGISADRGGGPWRYVSAPVGFKHLRLDVVVEDVPRFGAGPAAVAG